jgi:hypothetical protein
MIFQVNFIPVAIWAGKGDVIDIGIAFDYDRFDEISHLTVLGDQLDTPAALNRGELFSGESFDFGPNVHLEDPSQYIKQSTIPACFNNRGFSMIFQLEQTL